MLPRTAVALALTAGLAGEPSTLATARLGTLTVTSSVLVGAKAVDMRGVWNDTRVPYTVKRRLRVEIAAWP